MGIRNSVVMLGGGWPALQYLAYDRRGGGVIEWLLDSRQMIRLEAHRGERALRPV
jgi:hypothetical protein